jgi:hypothetical protein
MKGYRLTPVADQTASYGYPTPPDPAERRTPLIEPQGLNYAGAPRCEDCPDCGECVISVVRLGRFVRPECEMAFGGRTKILNKQSLPHLSETYKLVLRTLAGCPEGATGGRIARATGLARQRVRDSLEALVQRGLVTVDRNSRPYLYRYVSDGR